MKTVLWKYKAIEREKLLRMLREKVNEIPEPEFDSIGYDHEWYNYCSELRELEIAFINAGGRL